MSDCITTEDFQVAFKAVSEKTTPSLSGLHYSIWKVLAQEDDIVSWLSTMMSILFEFGFVNKRWTTEINVMLKKERYWKNSPTTDHWDP